MTDLELEARPSSGDKVRVAIGILARNESQRIAALLADVAKQTILTVPGVDIEINVVANGCSDDTVAVAERALEDTRFQAAMTRVHEVSRAGKANAWNTFVHSLITPGAQYVFFLDADIAIPSDDALLVVLRSLMGSPTAVVAIDRSVKDLDLERPRTVAERLIKCATGTANDTQTAIAGAFYCVRFKSIEDIWLPLGLPGEDGFLRAMLLTSSFSHEERLDFHCYVPEVYHVFESMRDTQGVISHNLRLAIGTAINILLFHHLRRIRQSGRAISDYIRARNSQDPDWVNELVRERLKTSYFPLEPSFVGRRLHGHKRPRSLKGLGVTFLGLTFDVLIFCLATSRMRNGAGAGYW